MNDENKDYINNQEQETDAFEKTESIGETAEEVNPEADDLEIVTDEEAHEEPVIQIEQEDCQEFLVSDKKKEKKWLNN